MRTELQSPSDATLKSIIELRHESHREPRLPNHEADVADRLVAFLKSECHGENISFMLHVGGTGVVAVLPLPGLMLHPSSTQEQEEQQQPSSAQEQEEQQQPSSTQEQQESTARTLVLLRAELDSLAIDESSSSAIPDEWRSRHAGVSSKCGHDGHHASMICAFLTLAHRFGPAAVSTNKKNGQDASLGAEKCPIGVALLLQPAEETGEGARRVAQDPKFLSLFSSSAKKNTAGESSIISFAEGPRLAPYDLVLPISYHNVPGLPFALIATRRGTFAKASVGLRVCFTGSPAHASQPQEGHSPAMHVAQCLTAIGKLPAAIVKRKKNYSESRSQTDETSTVPNDDDALLTITHAQVGEATFGVAPGSAVIHCTIRANTWDKVTMIVNQVENCVSTVVAGMECDDGSNDISVSFEHLDGFRETSNRDANMISAMSDVARHCGTKGEKDTKEYDKYSDKEEEGEEKERFRSLPDPFPWSEDFGEIIRVCEEHSTLTCSPIPTHNKEKKKEADCYPAGRGKGNVRGGAMVAIGSGEKCPALHTVDYDYPDALIYSAATFFATMTVELLLL